MQIKNIIILFLFLFFPVVTFAGNPYYTLPIDLSDSDISLTAWFDHDGVSNQMTKYNGNVYSGSDSDISSCILGCYDGHRGIDYGTSGVTGKDIFAADGGVVKRAKWENINDFGQGYGFHVAIYHSIQDHCTVYGHLASTSIVSFNDSVDREDIIGSSGNTGQSSGAHLHFSIYAGGNTASSQCVGLYSADQVDPYGWLGGGSDPRTNNIGYLWTTDPPSFNLYNTVSSNISTSTIWRDGQVYLVSGMVSINSGSILTIHPGAVVKFSGSSSGLNVNGNLYAEGSSSSKIYFTSIHDDSVGGDTNNNGTSTTPSSDDWHAVRINSNASTTLSHSVVKYGGGYNYTYGNSYTNLYNNGGVLDFIDSELSNNTNRGIWHILGTTTIANSNLHDIPYAIYSSSGSGYINVASSTIHDNWYGIHTYGGQTLNIVDNDFYNHSGSPVYIGLDSGAVFTHSGNSFAGTGPKGLIIGGSVGTSQEWNGESGLVYLIDQVTIPSGKIITINEGSIIKFRNPSSMFTVSGILDIQGSSTSPVYLTSFHNDLIGGDTNSNGTSTYPSLGDWDTIKINSNATTSLLNAIVSYGGYGGTFGQNSYSNIYNNGGVLQITDSEVASSSSRGIYQVNGSSIISGSEIHNQYYGIRFSGGSMDANYNSIHNNPYGGIYNSTATLVDAENNYWGSSSGPYHSSNPSGAGNPVTDYVDFDPYLTTWP